MKRFVCSLILAGLCLPARHVRAQSVPEPPRRDREPLLSVYDASFLAELPNSDNLFNVVDALQPTIISDRIAAGGLAIGQATRLGGFLTSTTQTTYRVDGVPFTDPSGNGAPLFTPTLLPWSSMRVTHGLPALDGGRSNLNIELTATQPTTVWSGVFEGALTGGALTASGRGAMAPPIAGVDRAGRGGAVIGGPLVPGRVNATFAFSAANGREFERDDAVPRRAFTQSALTRFDFTPNARDNVRLLGWLQRSSAPLEQRLILSRPLSTLDSRGGFGLLAWDRRSGGGSTWHMRLAYGERVDTPKTSAATSGVIERLLDGPVATMASLSDRSIRTWSAAAQVDPIVRGQHRIAAGFDIDGARLRSTNFFSGTVGELVNGSPARVWSFSAPGSPSSRRSLTAGGFVNDTIAINRKLTLDAGVRFETLTGSAAGAANGVTWHNLLPRVNATLRPHEGGSLALFAGIARTGTRLALDSLAIGDPAAPRADIYRWTTLAGYPLSLADRGARVAVGGPGTGGDVTFTGIDPELKRPVTDELMLGIEGRPFAGFLLRVTGVHRRERNLWAVVNTGVDASGYTSFTVPDPGGNVLDPEDDRVLTVFNRLPSSFARDRFLWTTPGHSGSTFNGIEITLQYHRERFSMSGGGTAGLAETYAANTGYGPLENEQTVLGELFTSPNATNYAFGRPFTDRAFTGKIAWVYRFPRELTAGFVTRYQDGQSFSRVIVPAGLNQGAEPIRAFAAGDSRFFFVAMLDARIKKRVVINGRALELFADGYNVLNMLNSYEEDAAQRPDVRTAIAVQPPRSLHVGLRFTF